MATAAGPLHPFDCFSTLIDRHGAAAFIENDEFKTLTTLTKFTNSRPLDSKVWDKNTKRTKSSLKSFVRSGVDPEVRRKYWLAMLQIVDEDVILYSRAIGQPDDSKTRLSPPPPVLKVPIDLPIFSLGPNFGTSYNRLSHFLSTDVSIVPILSHFLLHFLEEWESYIGVHKLLQRQAWIDRNRTEEKASRLTLIKLINTHLKSSSLSIIKPVGMGESIFIHEIISLWSFWPFYNKSFWMIVRVLDLYLLEGPKVLYRFALAAIKSFVSSSGFEDYRTNQLSLSQYIPHYISSLSLKESSKLISEAISLPHLPSWETIFKNWLFNCSLAEQQSPPSSSPFSLSLSPPPALGEEGAAVMDNGGKKEKRKFSLGGSFSSDIIDETMVDTLVDWFPDWAFGDTLECLFQASKNGYNLRTLFHKCEEDEPLVLIVKTLKESVFGAFIATSLTERSKNSFFGSGETFLFTLKPHPKVFQWTTGSDLIMRANDDEIIIGSGGGHYGLWIDGDLYRGSTATCAAYANPPLTGSGSEDFYCAAIEVFRITWSQSSQ
ncbi:PREDICTED: TBC1 domain family member 24-like isoform X1 [Amphimedon queenslandica]|uniref:TLDc domain-containing protein n=1 Tax=Amphimedon queenslandica TaxID=400682 RepID=A0AAN0JYK2_AMPQE|nr:PREDICTED: TBC1 domain family member 24-like isoform X1 [Amphimedon queenslandica]|eukprot:XP_019862056.1 PREDICTED: TBC1 domain family member 24-like isoform X1 [Amphimedon queenslandica]